MHIDCDSRNHERKIQTSLHAQGVQQRKKIIRESLCDWYFRFKSCFITQDYASLCLLFY
jgi:hypothetical protein